MAHAHLEPVVMPKEGSLMGLSEGQGSSLLNPSDPVWGTWDSPRCWVHRASRVPSADWWQHVSLLSPEAVMEEGTTSLCPGVEA